MNDDLPFSQRHGFTSTPPANLLRQTAPEQLRLAVVHFAAEAGYRPSQLRDRVLDVLCVPPDADLWRNDDNILKEVQGHLARAEWYEIYDVIESLHREMLRRGLDDSAAIFERKINRVLEKNGIAWKVANGAVEARGPETFESVIKNATDSLKDSGLTTAGRELHEALLDLSRRPAADLTGAIQHSAAALECVARYVTGDSRATLGQILTKFPDILPPPLPDAMSKVWGYASERARHMREGAQPTQAEAELMVGLTAAVANYLVQEISRRENGAG